MEISEKTLRCMDKSIAGIKQESKTLQEYREEQERIKQIMRYEYTDYHMGKYIDFYW